MLVLSMDEETLPLTQPFISPACRQLGMNGKELKQTLSLDRNFLLSSCTLTSGFGLPGWVWSCDSGGQRVPHPSIVIYFIYYSGSPPPTIKAHPPSPQFASIAPLLYSARYCASSRANIHIRRCNTCADLTDSEPFVTSSPSVSTANPPLDLRPPPCATISRTYSSLSISPLYFSLDLTLRLPLPAKALSTDAG